MLHETPVSCPYCGETITLLVDASPGDQSYIEDCGVCCRPMRVTVAVDATCDVVAVTTERED